MSIEDQQTNERLNSLLKKMDMFLGIQIHNQNLEAKKKEKSNLEDFHNKSKKIINGDKSENTENSDIRYETNEYLKKIAENSSKEREERRNAKIKISPKDFLSSPLESLNSLRSTDNVFGSLKNLGSTLNTPGKTVTGSLLQAPSAVLNLFKDVSKTRRLKKMSDTTKDIETDKQVFSNLSSRLEELRTQPKDKQDATRIAKLENLLIAIKQSTDSKEERLVKLMASELRKTEKDPKFKDKDVLEEYRTKKEDDIRQSVKDKNYESRFNQLFNISDKLATTKTTSIEQKQTKDAAIIKASEKKTSRGSVIPTFDSFFSYKIPISESKPTTYAETIGGIFYRLGVLNEKMGQQQPQTQEGGSSGFWSLLGGGILAAVAWLRNKLPGLISNLGGKFKGIFSGISNKLGGLFSSIKASMGKITSKLSTMFPNASKAAKSIIDRGSSIIKKIPGITKGFGGGFGTTGKIAGGILKGAAKKLPLLGALYAGVSEARDIKGPLAKKGAVGAGVTGGSLLGAAGGAATGAALGSVVPIVGTGIGAIAGAIIGGIGGEKLGKYIGSGLFDFFDKENKKEVNGSGSVSQILKTDKELQRASDKSAEMKLQEIAFYNALKKHGAEDIDMYGRKRAFLQANAMNQEFNQ